MELHPQDTKIVYDFFVIILINPIIFVILCNSLMTNLLNWLTAPVLHIFCCYP